VLPSKLKKIIEEVWKNGTKYKKYQCIYHICSHRPYRRSSFLYFLGSSLRCLGRYWDLFNHYRPSPRWPAWHDSFSYYGKNRRKWIINYFFIKNYRKFIYGIRVDEISWNRKRS